MTRIRVGDEVFGVERGANAEFVAVQEREVIAPKPTALEARKYCPVIDRTYALDEVLDATRYVETGQKTGNVVLQVIEASPGRQLSPREARRGGAGVRVGSPPMDDFATMARSTRQHRMRR